MGSAASAPGRDEKEIAKAARQTGFTLEEVRYLHKRFKGLCKSNPDKLSAQDLPDFGSQQANDFAHRIFNTFEKDAVDDVTFGAFVKGAATFRADTPVGVKLQYIFEMLDFNFDDELESKELMEVLRLVRPGLALAEYNALLTKIFEEVCPGQDTAVITRDEFVSYAKKIPGIENMLTIDVQKAVVAATPAGGAAAAP
mmetsp:Transcript_29895/g.69124  ORF Transcript_29895/g.69124 Transcript_29895/m.69124 type:complete len:198 (-) Transcript_29895:79-672(-)